MDDRKRPMRVWAERTECGGPPLLRREPLKLYLDRTCDDARATERLRREVLGDIEYRARERGCAPW